MNVDNDETAGVRFRFLNWEHKGASMSDTDPKRSHSQASKVDSGKTGDVCPDHVKGNKSGGGTARVEDDEDRVSPTARRG